MYPTSCTCSGPPIILYAWPGYESLSVGILVSSRYLKKMYWVTGKAGLGPRFVLPIFEDQAKRDSSTEDNGKEQPER